MLGIGLLAYRLTRTPEPVYEGKTVSAWIKQLSFNYGSFGVRVSPSGKDGSVPLLRSPAANPSPWADQDLPTNLSQHLPDFMQPRPGYTNVYVIDDSPDADRVLFSLADTGALTTTNVRVSIGTQTNFAISAKAGLVLLLRSGYATTGRVNIALPGPVKPAPGLNLIHVYPTEDPPGAGKAVVALQAIGTPALPYLDRALHQQNRPFHRAYLRVYSWLGQWAGRWLPEPDVDAVFTQRAADVLARMPAQ